LGVLLNQIGDPAGAIGAFGRAMSNDKSEKLAGTPAEAALNMAAAYLAGSPQTPTSRDPANVAATSEPNFMMAAPSTADAGANTSGHNRGKGKNGKGKKGKGKGKRK
jgi:hypothetical protein